MSCNTLSSQRRFMVIFICGFPTKGRKFSFLQIDLINLCKQLLEGRLFLHLDVHVFIK